MQSQIKDLLLTLCELCKQIIDSIRAGTTPWNKIDDAKTIAKSLYESRIDERRGGLNDTQKHWLRAVYVALNHADIDKIDIRLLEEFLKDFNKVFKV